MKPVPKTDFPRHKIFLHLDLGLVALQNCEKQMSAISAKQSSIFFSHTQATLTTFEIAFQSGVDLYNKINTLRKVQELESRRKLDECANAQEVKTTFLDELEEIYCHLRGMAKGKQNGHTERKIIQVKTRNNNKKKKKDLTECQREIFCVS